MENLFLKVDRWFLNVVFKNKRIFYVNTDQCIDEFGNHFGKKGNHFFIKALEKRTKKKIINSLIIYYKKNHIKSVNQLLGKNINHPYGEMYFLPWENNRVRNLEKFFLSHKVGPTSIKTIEVIVDRLLKTLKKIQTFGFHPFILNSFPRVIKVKNNDNEKYIIRDGQHRLACLSFLGVKKIPVCYEADHWKPSYFFLKIYQLFNKKKISYNHKKLFCIEQINNWPHIKDKVISKKDALKLFKHYYKSV